MFARNVFDELKGLLPGKVFTSEEILKKHSCNQFYINSRLPDAVCYAESEEDVVNVVNFCMQKKIPIIPYGSGTSVEGHTAAINGGVCLNMTKMNKVIEFNDIDRYVIVQPGIAYNILNEFLESHGYHFPVEAGWGASIGGMVSTNASGPGATDAGSMSKNVMSCDVVVCGEGSATKIKTGTKAPKSSAGYNLTSLFVGSEGTLGVITEVCLRIRENFSCTKTICCQFEELDQSINFVVKMKKTIQFRRVELLDKLQTAACVSYSNITNLYNNKFTVIMELAGNEHTVYGDVRLITEFLNKNQVDNIKVYEDKKSAEQIWMMRKHACPAAMQFIDSGKRAMATDVSVPLSKLAECIKACYGHMTALNLKAPLVAHIGDGNFHFTILVNPEDKSDLDIALQFNKLVVVEALKVGGTCTGEHGIGIGKKSYLEIEHGDSLIVMENIKKSFDPLNVFNPGKIISLNKRSCHHSYDFKPAVMSCDAPDTLQAAKL